MRNLSVAYNQSPLLCRPGCHLHYSPPLSYCPAHAICADLSHMNRFSPYTRWPIIILCIEAIPTNIRSTKIANNNNTTTKKQIYTLSSMISTMCLCVIGLFGHCYYKYIECFIESVADKKSVTTISRTAHSFTVIASKKGDKNGGRQRYNS